MYPETLYLDKKGIHALWAELGAILKEIENG